MELIKNVPIFNYKGNDLMVITPNAIDLDDFTNKPIISYLENKDGEVIGIIDKATRIDDDGFIYGDIYLSNTDTIGKFSNYSINLSDYECDDNKIIVNSMIVYDITLDGE